MIALAIAQVDSSVFSAIDLRDAVSLHDLLFARSLGHRAGAG
jgi:hypothetical protein